MEELKLEQVGGGGDCRVDGTSPHSRTPSSIVCAREAGRVSTCGGSIVRPWGSWMVDGEGKVVQWRHPTTSHSLHPHRSFLPTAHSHGHVPGLAWGQGLLWPHQLHS